MGSWVLDGPLDFSPTHRVSRNPDQLCRDGHVHPSMLAFGCPPPNTHTLLLWTILELFMSLLLEGTNKEKSLNEGKLFASSCAQSASHISFSPWPLVFSCLEHFAPKPLLHLTYSMDTSLLSSSHLTADSLNILLLSGNCKGHYNI